MLPKFKYTLKIILFIEMVVCTFKVFPQDKINILRNIMEYNLEQGWHFELNKIVQKIRLENSQLIFFISIEEKDDYYFIFISLEFEINPEIDYKGFFYIEDKLFLITSEIPYLFFKPFRYKKINFEITTIRDDSIFEPYIDELPIFVIEYRNKKFTNIYSSY